MNRRSAGAQLALPGLAPLCPHCGGRRTAIASAADAISPERGAISPEAAPPPPSRRSADGAPGDLVTGAEWQCASCGRTFWQLSSLGTR